MSEAFPQVPNLEKHGLVDRNGAPSYPGGSRWWPGTWLRILVWRWKLYGPVEQPERRGYWFWGPTVGVVLTVELLAALSASVKNAIPWPTISSTIGHLEKRWDWVAVIVVGLITVVAFHAIAYRAQQRDRGRAYRRAGPARTDKPAGRDVRWYNALLVAVLTGIAIGLAIVFGASKFQLGYVIYGVLGFFGIVLPSILAFAANRLVGFPSLFFTLEKLRHRLHAVAVIVVAGLTILAVHLAFYPWPDITHESARFAGLSPDKARANAEQKLKTIRAGTPALRYSTQAKNVVDGTDAWFVYFRSPSGTATGCVVTVTKNSATPSPSCFN
jgi:hypothetical protein